MMFRRLSEPYRLPLFTAVLLLTGAAGAESTPAFDAAYASSPKSWFDAVSESDYFNPSLTRSWQLNEACDDTGAFSVASYNIFHNVPFVTDFGDEMEQSLGKVTKCADVLLFQEAWDYDDIIQDGPKADLAARGYSMLTPTGYYCDDSLEGAIENDCSGLVLFHKSGTVLVKELGFQAFTDVNGVDVHKEKGVWGAIFAKAGRYYYVFTTHFTYGSNSHLDGDAASDASRISNMRQSLAYIRAAVTANRASYPPAFVLFGGDFNADFTSAVANSKGRQLLIQAAADGFLFEPHDYRQTGATLGAYELPGFQSNWTGTAVDAGPNGMATGPKGDFDTVLLGKPATLGTCAASRISYSGWAPAWKTLNGAQRIWPTYTHSDHYGRWIQVKPGC
ncbi:endonuclease [Stigmatella sp. ncwal1]|uniref:Endonuclease n=1 Tax=Stigmatella ashevillensis TaxID=2995309 RepID=A0ABT5DQK2_9BACT|nr:endonuclease [Stigmatella ashevillena]MDC0714646.1 endonuclease [Stigmatella ashevillena]